MGPLITGLLQTKVGFHYGFGAAAVGMALGLTQYVVFRRNLGSHGRTPPNPLSRSHFVRTASIAAAVVVVVVVAFVFGLITLATLSQVTTGILIVASIGYFAVMLRSRVSNRWSARGFGRSSRCSSPMRCSGRCSSRSSPCSRCTPTSG